jgi:WD40 repeat protein
VPAGVLQTDTLYKFSARHRSAEGPVSAWAEVQARTMLVFPTKSYLAFTVSQPSPTSLRVYEQDEDSFTELSDISIDGGTGDFSDDGNYFVIANATVTRLSVYAIFGDQYVLLPDPVVNSTDTIDPRWVSFSPHGDYIAAGGNVDFSAGNTKHLLLLKKQTSPSLEYVQIPNPSFIPTGVNQVPFSQFSRNGEYLAVSFLKSNATDRLVIYKRAGDVFTKLPEYLTSIYNFVSVSFSKDDLYLAVADAGAKIHILKRSGDVFTPLTEIDYGTSKVVNHIEFSPDGKTFAATRNDTILMYDVTDDVFTQITGLDVNISSAANRCSFSRDSTYFAYAQSSVENVVVHKRIGNTFFKLNNAISSVNAFSLFVMFTKN